MIPVVARVPPRRRIAALQLQYYKVKCSRKISLCRVLAEQHPIEMPRQSHDAGPPEFTSVSGNHDIDSFHMKSFGLIVRP